MREKLESGYTSIAVIQYSCDNKSLLRVSVSGVYLQFIVSLCLMLPIMLIPEFYVYESTFVNANMN